ncbi:FHIPEP family type III secretion protein [Vibrio parahaemolyticus]|uniref:Putative type III secretion system apparatus protein VcrD2 n=8 Tax=Vibrio parahaemolyticus TaxID=670 RepID=B9A7Z2_VIBPH|nr:FHIPEP family type III secretion protein [Vibrio parahaemolyticus]EJG0923779.1 FHIPEP family type III secretion protein [Vibrio parahaemolyticus O1:K68]EJG0933445.1 FHIPEP family type III secretion protein [Vibrio parahaemolyticus O1]EJG0947587.1 FHIPEP family type III secretion protein [Vibrio parahaemolyticus O10]EGQ7826026.1 FHIPEP family type III secretion protein [Vibrio parahaemolyticus]EGQ8608905.1 type III secretion protein [Vibrio parahaemolyticus]
MISKLRNSTLLFNPSSVMIAFLLPTIILVTLPGVVIDFFLLISFVSSALLLIIMLENDQPLKVTFLPTMVLLLTTFRLLLSIATTRNIIANEDVGRVIETIGEFVMGGNLISGLLIFVIITIVQFLVVTKGGERVAEVGARFSLDALPGKQMTIDGDLKSGLISGEQAQKLRADLGTENKLFGSLDGAMKFVKGDAIAGILISLVNLFGGIYVGINQFDLSLSESVKRFSVLTIGDGLVSQIPSLLLSMACGVYLTRIKGSEDESSSFISQMMAQIRTFWKSLLVVGVVIMLIGLLNPTLMYVCLPLAVLCVVMALLLWKKNGNNSVAVKFEPEGSGVFESLKFVFRDGQYQSLIKKRLKAVEERVWGQALGEPAVLVDPDLDVDIAVYISGIQTYQFSQSSAEGIVEILNDDTFNLHDDLSSNLDEIISYFIQTRLIEKYNLQHSCNIVAELASQSEIMKSEIDSAVGLNRVHDVLKQMIRSPEFYLDRVSFFESLIYWSRVENDPRNWLTRIRHQARYEITARLLNSDGKVHVMLLSPELTEEISGYVAGEFEDFERLIEIQKALKSEIKRLLLSHKNRPVLVVNDNELNVVKTFVQQVMSTLIVCSHSDIVDNNCISSSEVINIQ